MVFRCTEQLKPSDFEAIWSRCGFSGAKIEVILADLALRRRGKVVTMALTNLSLRSSTKVKQFHV